MRRGKITRKDKGRASEIFGEGGGGLTRCGTRPPSAGSDSPRFVRPPPPSRSRRLSRDTCENYLTSSCFCPAGSSLSTVGTSIPS